MGRRRDFAAEYPVAYAELADTSVDELKPFFVSPKPMLKGGHARWWLAAKSHWMAAPRFAQVFLIQAEPGHEIIENWNHEEIIAFSNWAETLPAWNDGEPLLVLHQKNGRLSREAQP